MNETTLDGLITSALERNRSIRAWDAPRSRGEDFQPRDYPGGGGIGGTPGIRSPRPDELPPWPHRQRPGIHSSMGRKDQRSAVAERHWSRKVGNAFSVASILFVALVVGWKLVI